MKRQSLSSIRERCLRGWSACGLVLALSLAGILSLAGCKKQPTQSSDIVIGEYGSLTGSNALFGQSTDLGIRLALDEINERGGVLGKQVRLIREDDEGKQDEAIAAVKKLINRDDVVAILGEVASTRSLAGGGVCEQAHVPMISPSSTNPDVTKDKKYVFRVCYTDDFQGAVGARFAIKQGWKRIAIFTCADSDYSKKLSSFFKQAIAKAGLQPVAEETYNSGDTNFTAQLTRIRSANPDAVYLPGYYDEIDLILRQARGLGLNCPFFGGDGWDGVQLNKMSDGCYFTNHFSPDDKRPGVQEFVAAFRAKYDNRMPDGFAITGYDAARVLCNAIQRAGSLNRDAITNAIASTKDFPGASGTITIDANHNAKKPIVILKIVDGHTELADTIQPD